MDLIIKHTEDGKCVYLIINKVTNQCYVGSTRNSLYKRMVEHRRHLRKGVHINKKLQYSYNKYGDDSFYFKYKKVSNEDDILKFEYRFYKLYKTYYNIATDILNGGKPNLGAKLTKEWKNNLVKSREGYKHSKETLEIVTKNNKENATKVIFTKDDEILKFNSYVEAGIYLNVSSSSLITANSRYGKWRGWIIEVISSQKKRVKLSKDDFEIVLNSTL